MPKFRRRPAHHSADLFEPLEPRLALYTSPALAGFPDPSAMSNTQNTVVRLYTTAGAIDIELYDQFGPSGASSAPITTENFINYITRGRFDNTFFHRLATATDPETNEEEDFVLQGGGFQFTLPSTSTRIETDDPIQNEFDAGRSNAERTVAMAKLGGNPNSATSQFFFNLGDNGSRIVNGQENGLDHQNGGFTVFGKVIGGWDIVTTIADFATRDLDQFLTGTNSTPGLYDEVPLSGENNTDLVTILNAEIIKPADQTSFYTTSLYFPEGWRDSKVTSHVDIVNQDVNGSISYEIIAHFETGNRDRVITRGTLEPGARISVPISRGGDPSINNVRPNTAFAYEVRATGPAAASLHHTDFGAMASENFVDPMQLTEAQLKDWTFADGLKGPGLPSFLLWQNLTGQEATVTATFFNQAGETFSIAQKVGAFRRGGLNVGDLTGVPTGLYSVHVTSTQAIVASLSQYRAVPGRASMELGMLDGGAEQAVLPGGVIDSDGQSLLSLIYTGAESTVTVAISFILSDGSVLDGGEQTLGSGQRRRDFDLSVLNGALPRDEFFSIRYSVAGGHRVGAGYSAIIDGDTVRTGFQSVSTSNIFFADGFLDPSSNTHDVISLYNPFVDEEVTVTYRLRFHFVSNTGDEFILPMNAQGTLANGGRIDIDVADLASILEKIGQGEQFRRYSVSVETDITSAGDPLDNAAIFGQITRYGLATATATSGPTLSHSLTAVELSDPVFGA